jgi:hypothetical protein
MIISSKRKFKAYGTPVTGDDTFKNNTDDPQLLFRSRTIIDSLEDFGLRIAVRK